MINFENMTDEQIQQNLDELRDHHPINGALQDLAPFVIHATENQGKITPRNVLYLVEAAENAVNVILPECQRLEIENSILRQRNIELMFLVGTPKGIEGNA